MSGVSSMIRRVLPVLAAAVLLVGCAAKPPGPVSAADRAAPHVLASTPPEPTIEVDGDTGYTVPGFVATSPAGMIGGLIGQAIVASIEIPAAQRRAERRAALAAALGDTTSTATLFATTFDAELEARLRSVPGLQLRPPVAAGGEAKPADDVAVITVARSAVVSTDARMLVGRASASHRAVGGTGPTVVRHYLVFSADHGVVGDAAAVEAWRVEDGRLPRERTQEVARELARLVNSQLFELEEQDIQKLRWVRMNTPGAGLHNMPRSMRLTETAWGYLVNRSAERSLLAVPAINSPGTYIWVSVPNAAVPSAGS